LRSRIFANTFEAGLPVRPPGFAAYEGHRNIFGVIRIPILARPTDRLRQCPTHADAQANHLSFIFVFHLAKQTGARR
jgi:hypothetical protein